MPNLPRLSRAPFISPTNNMLLIPCFMDEVHAVSYLVLSITSNCLQLPASVFKVISLQPLRLMKSGCAARGGHPPPALAEPRSRSLKAEAELQPTAPNFAGVHAFFCSQGRTVLGVCAADGEPAVARELDSCPRVFPGHSRSRSRIWDTHRAFLVGLLHF